ncbi:MAG: nucleotide exchange factor GrpE [Candidatus Paceibacterota bacterium]
MPKKKKPEKNFIEEELVDDVTFEDDSVGISDKIKKVQGTLKECEKERQEYLDGWQRARASLVNREKELLEEKSQAISRTELRVFSELFPVLDSFDMAFSNKDAWGNVDKEWRVGIEHIYTQALRIFEQAGITEINAEGLFDPQLHEPIQTEVVESEEVAGRIIKVAQKGYRKGDTILRPAKVVIGIFE